MKVYESWGGGGIKLMGFWDLQGVAGSTLDSQPGEAKCSFVKLLVSPVSPPPGKGTSEHFPN